MAERLSRHLVAALAAVAFACAAPPSSAGIVAERVPVLPFATGLTLEFATHQIAHGESRYWTRIVVEDAGLTLGGRPSWTRYRYAMYGGERQSRTGGEAEIPDLEACTALNPWWGPDQDAARPYCDLWLSGEVFEAVRIDGRAPFEIDLYYRGDAGVTLSLVEHAVYAVEVDGRTIELPVLVLESSAGDELRVLDDAANPLVLWSRVPGVYAWGVTRAWSQSEAPPEEPRRGVTALPEP